MALSHDQLKTQAAPGFGEVGADCSEKVMRATDALIAIGTLRSDEEVDQRFLEWFAPKQEQMLNLANDLAGTYRDLGKGLDAMSLNVKTVDWGLADDLKKVPDYLADGPVKRPDA